MCKKGVQQHNKACTLSQQWLLQRQNNEDEQDANLKTDNRVRWSCFEASRFSSRFAGIAKTFPITFPIGLAMLLMIPRVLRRSCPPIRIFIFGLMHERVPTGISIS